MDKMIFTRTCHQAVIALAAIIASSLTLFSPPVDAAVTVNVDFSAPGTPSAGLYNGSAVAPNNGGTIWNDVLGNNGTSGALVTSTGLATVSPVTVTLSAVTGAVDGTLYGNAAIAPALLNDYAYVNTSAATTGTFSIAGLSAGGSYDLYLYAQNQIHASSSTIFTIGSSQTANNANTPGNAPSFTLTGNYVLYSGLIANGSGIISGTFTTGRPDEDNGVFNGFQLVGDLALATPEPSTVTLLLLGSLLCLRARRR